MRLHNYTNRHWGCCTGREVKQENLDLSTMLVRYIRSDKGPKLKLSAFEYDLRLLRCWVTSSYLL